MAPNKLDDNATRTGILPFSKVEKANPEKKSGRANTNGKPILMIQTGRLLNPRCVIPYPSNSEKQRNAYVEKGFNGCRFITATLAKKAMTMMAAIIALMTTHVLPYAKANSVIPFVSISIKPAPRKKAGAENPAPTDTPKRRMVIRETNKRAATRNKQETGYFRTGI